MHRYKIINSCKDIVDIDNDKIFIESNSKNTIENMKYSKEMLDNLKKSGQISDIKRVMIITSSFHCKRAMLSMKKYFPDVEVMSCPSTNDLTEKGSIFNKESMMKNPYYMDQFRKELNAIVSYTRNGSIYDDEIDVNIRDKNDDIGR